MVKLGQVARHDAIESTPIDDRNTDPRFHLGDRPVLAAIGARAQEDLPLRCQLGEILIDAGAVGRYQLVQRDLPHLRGGVTKHSGERSVGEGDPQRRRVDDEDDVGGQRKRRRTHHAEVLVVHACASPSGCARPEDNALAALVPDVIFTRRDASEHVWVALVTNGATARAHLINRGI
jgi:hypothetical protein